MPTAIARRYKTSRAFARRAENGNTKQGVAANKKPPITTQFSMVLDLTAPDAAM
jgi:hypothetical protein